MGNIPALKNSITNHLIPQVNSLAEFLIGPGASLGLAEALPIWMLPWSAQAAPDPLAGALKTGDWHHQLTSYGGSYFATSTEGPDPDDWRVSSLFESDRAAVIAAGIAQLDLQPGPFTEVRLLEAPDFLILGLWVINTTTPNQVLVLSEGQKVLSPELKSEADFVALLQGARQIKGRRPPSVTYQ